MLLLSSSVPSPTSKTRPPVSAAAFAIISFSPARTVGGGGGGSGGGKRRRESCFVVLGLLTFKEPEEEEKDKGYIQGRGPAYEVERRS